MLHRNVSRFYTWVPAKFPEKWQGIVRFNPVNLKLSTTDHVISVMLSALSKRYFWVSKQWKTMLFKVFDKFELLQSSPAFFSETTRPKGLHFGLVSGSKNNIPRQASSVQSELAAANHSKMFKFSPKYNFPPKTDRFSIKFVHLWFQNLKKEPPAPNKMTSVKLGYELKSTGQ